MCAGWKFMIAAVALASTLARAQTRLCPESRRLPQLQIDDIRDPVMPVVDTWQVFWRGVAISDLQLAQLAEDDVLTEKLREPMENRGAWVYVGLVVAAAGAAASSTGWVLYGQNNVPRTAALSLSIGGLLLGLAGVLTMTESIQTPLEPHLAPTPRHRISRELARTLVATVNHRLYSEICAAVQDSAP
jgi:hypothetical protein